MKKKGQRRAGKETPVVQTGAPKRPGWAIPAVVFGAALMLGILVYAPALDGPFLLDDLYLPFARPEAEAGRPFWPWKLRPVLMATFYLNYQAAGFAPWSYHLVNVFLHAVVALLVFFILRRLTEKAVADSAKDLIAPLGAGIFLLHPLQTESVAYIASRSEVLSTLFAYGALAVFLHRPQAEISWPRAILVLGLLAAAMGSKEHTAAMVAVLMLTDYFWNPGFSLRGIARSWKVYAPMALLAVPAVSMIRLVLRTADTAGFGLQDLAWHEYALTQCRAFWKYLQLFVAPIGQNVDPYFPVSRSLFDHGAAIGLVAIALSVGAAWWFRKRAPLISYGFFVFVILLAPTSSILPIRDPLAERRLYLPFIGLLLMLAGTLVRWSPPRRTLVFGGTALLGLLAALTYSRAALWGNPTLLWEDAVKGSPNKMRPHFQLAHAYYRDGRCADAVTLYAKAAKLEPPDIRLLTNWALALECAGKPEEALARLQEAVKIEPSAHLHSTIGMIHAKQGRYSQALAALAEAQKLDPQFTMAYVYEGNVRALQGDAAAARDLYQKALRIDPSNAAARQSLALLGQSGEGQR